MSTLTWIIASSLLMSAIALVGSVTLILKESALQRIILPLVAFLAGALIGGRCLLSYNSCGSLAVWDQ